MFNDEHKKNIDKNQSDHHQVYFFGEYYKDKYLKYSRSSNSPASLLSNIYDDATNGPDLVCLNGHTYLYQMKLLNKSKSFKINNKMTASSIASSDPQPN